MSETTYFISSDGQLMHYGVVGMKWGVRRARKTGGTYSYKSRATKRYEKKAKKAEIYGDTANSAKFKKYAQRSAKLDKGMEKTARNMSAGRTAAATILNGSFALKTYAAVQGAGYNKAMAGVSAAVGTYMLGPFGTSAVRALYVRDKIGPR